MSIAVPSAMAQPVIVQDGMVTSGAYASDSISPNTDWRCSSNDTMALILDFFARYPGVMIGFLSLLASSKKGKAGGKRIYNVF